MATLALCAACANPSPRATDIALAELPAGPDVAEGSDQGIADGGSDLVGEVTEPPIEPPTEAPTLHLTINELPAHLNGSQPLPDGSPFAVWVNRSNFTLDLMSPKPDQIDWSTLSLSCTEPLNLPDGQQIAGGEELATHVTLHPLGLSSGVGRRIHFTSDVGVAESLQLYCQATVSNTLGEATDTTNFVIATMQPQLDPFVRPDVWLVMLSRDIFDTTFVDNRDGTYTVTSDHLPEGDGEPDFDEAFVGLGLFSTTNATVRAAVKEQLLGVIRGHANRIFGLDDKGRPTAEGVPLQLYFEGDDEAPSTEGWTKEGQLSLIALGGDGTPADQKNGIVGRADLDTNNQVANDNTIYDRGVYPAGIARAVLGQPLGVLAISDLLPGVGVPVGDHPDDGTFFEPGFEPSTLAGDKRHRFELIHFAIDMLGLALASTLCHEIGHSLGLVPPGPPPNGLFAGIPELDFIDNYIDDAHIDTSGLNVMQTGKVTNYIEAVSQVPAFNAINMAYLRRRLVVLSNP